MAIVRARSSRGQNGLQRVQIRPDARARSFASEFQRRRRRPSLLAACPAGNPRASGGRRSEWTGSKASSLRRLPLANRSLMNRDALVSAQPTRLAEDRFSRFSPAHRADFEGQQRADSAPTRTASGRTGVRTVAVLHCEREIAFAALLKRSLFARRLTVPRSITGICRERLKSRIAIGDAAFGAFDPSPAIVLPRHSLQHIVTTTIDVIFFPLVNDCGDLRPKIQRRQRFDKPVCFCKLAQARPLGANAITSVTGSKREEME